MKLKMALNVRQTVIRKNNQPSDSRDYCYKLEGLSSVVLKITVRNGKISPV